MRHACRALTVAAALLLPAGAQAACEGRDLAPGWTAEFRQQVSDLAGAQPHPQGRFFEVSRGGASSVLFGTIHLNEDAVATPPPALEERVRDAAELFLEVTGDEEKRMMRSVLLNPGRILAPADKRLRDEITAGEWARLEPLLAGYGIAPEIADRIAPWYLTITLANPACLIGAAGSGKPILDRRIEALAAEAGVTVSGLETFDDVFGLFQDMPYDEQIRMLRAGLPSFARAEDYLETTRQMYLRGDIQQIWAFGVLSVEQEDAIADSAEAVQDFFDKLLVGRNARWMETLLPALAEGDRVVAVGALHLGGEHGLLRLLEDEGFSVRRLD